MQTLQRLPAAKNQKAAVLRLLIESEGVSERDTAFNGFRTRISELKRIPDLNIHTIREPFVSQFGKQSGYNVHFLLDSEKDEAIKIYERLNK
jgi:hypothetical protein